ncbi:GNAT family N-acetyltransferase [Microvirga terricola]|uniref:GNAT family N-acetyltransferase n=1 Tax=Microvirga terricola TaxID=2719797 RepID=A0ABX0VDF6_9HYPH|nr:GNAT family N-acetyltransferase [Microvirga terricola]NIX76695.1 GNAT family N-acetyltransferase [Microvirga terricola]
MDTPPTQNSKIDARDLTIRSVRPADFEEIAALASLPGYRWGTLRLPYPSPEETRKWIESKTSVADASLVVVYDGKIVGNGGFGRYQGRRAHAAMLGMGIHDDYRGRGVGSHLLREILVLADDWHDLKRVELTVYTDNAPAIALYERNGFVIEGTHKAFAYREGAFVDAYAMARLKP